MFSEDGADHPLGRFKSFFPVKRRVGGYCRRFNPAPGQLSAKLKEHVPGRRKITHAMKSADTRAKLGNIDLPRDRQNLLYQIE
jgi:hypothetical protein